MSILIKGMKLPANGNETILRIQSKGTILDQYGLRLIIKAVPIPPHGRLGDLDKLIEKIDAIWDCNDMVFSPDDHCCNVPEDCKGCKWAETKNFIRKMIDNAQTIIPAEEVIQKDGGQ